MGKISTKFSNKKINPNSLAALLKRVILVFLLGIHLIYAVLGTDIYENNGDIPGIYSTPIR